MNEFGEPNMGKPSVRFDEGRTESAKLTTAVGSIRLLSLCLLYQVKPLKASASTPERRLPAGLNSTPAHLRATNVAEAGQPATNPSAASALSEASAQAGETHESQAGSTCRPGSLTRRNTS